MIHMGIPEISLEQGPSVCGPDDACTQCGNMEVARQLIGKKLMW